MIDKQQLQMLGEHQAEQHMCMAKQIEDLQARLQECANGAAKMQEQRDDLANQLEVANQQIAAFSGSLLSHVASSSEIAHGGSVSRALFERWFRRDYHPNKQGPYIKDITWAAWQAALAAAPKPEQTK